MDATITTPLREKQTNTTAKLLRALGVATGVAATMMLTLGPLSSAASAAGAASSKVRAWSSSHRAVVEFDQTKRLGPQPSTWYGPGFYGNRTACGSTLRTNTWGIAHRTLPCGTLVHLAFKGRSVVVPVIDRGPFGHANVDLTERTAQHLKFKAQGRGAVATTVVKRAKQQ